LFELLINFEPVGVVRYEIATFGKSGVEDLQVGLRKLIYVFGFYVLSEHFGYPQRIPLQRSGRQLVSKSASSIDHWPVLDQIVIENVAPYLSAYV